VAERHTSQAGQHHQAGFTAMPSRRAISKAKTKMNAKFRVEDSEALEQPTRLQI
jgi:hypothetical protein